MVGYGMAALLFRAFWPPSLPSAAAGASAIALYLWLGMAMSGPIIILRRRRERTPAAPEATTPASAPNSHTWAELAWSLIGGYWIVLAIFVIPNRLHEFRSGDMLLFGLVPVAVAMVLGLLGAGSAARHSERRAWTHRVAVVLVMTWPFVWICLIYLGRSMR
jgi:hypothetical protein